MRAYGKLSMDSSSRLDEKLSDKPADGTAPDSIAAVRTQLSAEVSFSSNKLISLLDAHIAETRAKFPDDPPYVGSPDYEKEDEENS